VDIIKADIQDSKIINQLMNKAFRGDSARKGWTHEADYLDGVRTTEEVVKNTIIEAKGTYFLVQTEGEIAGCVFYEKQGSKMYLGSLAVHPDLQAKGIGKAIMYHAEQYCKYLNCTTISMSVVSKRTELIEWYERKGYLNTGIIKPFPMDDRKFGEPKEFLEFIIMEKEIGGLDF